MLGTGSTSVRSYNYYLDTTVQGGGGYVDNEYDFVNSMDGAIDDGIVFVSHTIMLINDSATNNIYFSFDGVNDHGRLPPDRNITQDFRRVRKIWLRGTAGQGFRLWAW